MRLLLLLVRIRCTYVHSSLKCSMSYVLCGSILCPYWECCENSVARVLKAGMIFLHCWKREERVVWHEGLSLKISPLCPSRQEQVWETVFFQFKGLRTAERPKLLPQSHQIVYIKYIAQSSEQRGNKDNSCGESRVTLSRESRGRDSCSTTTATALFWQRAA